MKQRTFSVFSMRFPPFIIPVWAVCIFTLSCTSESKPEKNAVHRPNFLIYLSDDHGYQDAGYYGNPEGRFTNNIIIPRKGKPRPGIEPGFLWSSWEQAAQKNEKAATWTIRYRQRPRFELYDLQYDPEELINQADNPDYQEILKTLEASLYQWMQKQGDILSYRFSQTDL